MGFLSSLVDQQKTKLAEIDSQSTQQIDFLKDQFDEQIVNVQTTLESQNQAAQNELSERIC